MNETKKATIKYCLSEKGRKASLLAGGNGHREQYLDVELTPEIVQLGRVDERGNVLLVIGDEIEFDMPRLTESLIKFEQKRREDLRARAAEIEKRNAAKRAEIAKQKAEREAREQEKTDWITSHGSDHLRRAHKLGYDCQRKYVTERANQEFPDFAVDFNEWARWQSRACPSKDALDIVEKLIEQGHNAECVWLVHPPYGMGEDEYPDDFDPCEAVVVKDYLFKHTLVLALPSVDEGSRGN